MVIPVELGDEQEPALTVFLIVDCQQLDAWLETVVKNTYGPYIYQCIHCTHITINEHRTFAFKRNDADLKIKKDQKISIARNQEAFMI